MYGFHPVCRDFEALEKQQNTFASSEMVPLPPHPPPPPSPLNLLNISCVCEA